MRPILDSDALYNGLPTTPSELLFEAMKYDALLMQFESQDCQELVEKTEEVLRHIQYRYYKVEGFEEFADFCLLYETEYPSMKYPRVGTDTTSTPQTSAVTAGQYQSSSITSRFDVHDYNVTGYGSFSLDECSDCGHCDACRMETLHDEEISVQMEECEYVNSYEFTPIEECVEVIEPPNIDTKVVSVVQTFVTEQVNTCVTNSGLSVISETVTAFVTASENKQMFASDSDKQCSHKHNTCYEPTIDELELDSTCKPNSLANISKLIRVESKLSGVCQSPVRLRILVNKIEDAHHELLRVSPQQCVVRICVNCGLLLLKYVGPFMSLEHNDRPKVKIKTLYEHALSASARSVYNELRTLFSLRH